MLQRRYFINLAPKMFREDFRKRFLISLSLSIILNWLYIKLKRLMKRTLARSNNYKFYEDFKCDFKKKNLLSFINENFTFATQQIIALR